MLYLVPTPIGNLEDITLRAIRVLREVDLILAEDTRVTKRLLSKYDINTALSAFHSHNEHKRVDKIVEELSGGKNIALVSDAGSPGISDPGFLLTRAAVAAGVEMTSLPGPTALIPAIVMSGIPCDRFHFEGFLPQKKGKLTRIKYLLGLDNPFILYESPHRVIKTLMRIREVHTDLGHDTDIRACVVREISKIHEECIRGSIDEVILALEAKPSVKGEIVIVVDSKS